jgi:spore coat protein CotF
MGFWDDPVMGKDSLTDDKYIALTMLGGSKASAAAYLAATLESATPEIRQLYSGFCTQITQGQEALTNMAIENGWYHAYGQPVDQLTKAVSDSMKVIGTNA